MTQALAKQRKWFDTFAKYSNDIMILLNHKFEIQQLNKVAEKHYEWNHKDCYGHSIVTLCQEQQYPAPISTDTISLISTFQPVHHQTPAHANIQAVNWHIQLLLTDDSNNFLLTGNIDQSENSKLSFYLKQALDSAPGSIYWKNINGYYMGCNQFMVETAGLQSVNNFIGKTDYDLWPDNADKIRENDQQVMQSGIMQQVNETVKIHDGTTMYFTGLKMPLKDEYGNTIGVICNSLDITELEVTKKELAKAKEAADAANEAKTIFLENIRHDLRTPVSGILGVSEYLIDEVNGRQQDDLKDIYHCAKSLLDLLNQILEVSRITSNKLPVQASRFKLSELINDIHHLLKPAVKTKQLQFTIEYASNIPSHLICDVTRLHRIILNLASNAVKYTETGYVKIKLCLCNRVKQEAILSCSVIDSGIGLQTDKYQTIIKPFNKLAPSYSDKQISSGLGLVIVKQLLEELGGELYVQSELQLGTTFTCAIPCKIPLLDDANDDKFEEIIETNNEPPPLKSKPSTSTKKIKILIVEDNLVAQKVAQHLITKLNQSCDLATTGKDAIDKVTQQPYDLIFMDIGLPDMDGIEVTRKIRQLNFYMPIIGLTAHIAEEKKSQYLQAGFNNVLPKPLTLKQLDVVVRAVQL